MWGVAPRAVVPFKTVYKVLGIFGSNSVTMINKVAVTR